MLYIKKSSKRFAEETARKSKIPAVATKKVQNEEEENIKFASNDTVLE